MANTEQRTEENREAVSEQKTVIELINDYHG